MKLLSLIIKREFIAKVRNRSFIVMTFLSPLLILAMGLFIGYLVTINEDSVSKIAIHDTENALQANFKSTKNIHYINVSSMPLEVAKDTAKNSYEGILVIPKTKNIQLLKEKVTYISDDSPSIEFISKVENVIDSVLTSDNLQTLGIDEQKIEDAKVNSQLKLSKFSGDKSLKGLNEIKVALGSIMGYLIMMFIIVYGNFVMRSVIEEKTNRIIEIIISSVKPFQLMMGKIIGNSLAGLLQFIIWLTIGGILMITAQQFFGMQVDNTSIEQAATLSEKAVPFEKIQMYIVEIMNLPLLTMGISFIIYFIGGYFLYSSFYAAIGAAVDSETDSQQFLIPILMPLMLGVYIGFFTVIDDPHGIVATVFSIVPFTSPIVMLMRIPFNVPLWQLIVSILILFTTFVGVVWVAAKIYKVGILMYGKKTTWKELFKWLKY